jgi:hypothetical protein
MKAGEILPRCRQGITGWRRGRRHYAPADGACRSDEGGVTSAEVLQETAPCARVTPGAGEGALGKRRALGETSSGFNANEAMEMTPDVEPEV